MKNLKKMLLGCFSLVILSVFVVGCSGNDDTTSGTSRVKVSMTDAPGDFDAVFVDVVDVMIKNSNNSDDTGWVSLGNVNAGVYNLMDLTGGVTTLLANSELPSGYVGQIRLVLGENNTVVKDGVSLPLNTPSGQQSGLKLQINQTLQPNVTYSFLIDFDVNQSIVVQAGTSGIFNLVPVLRITTEAVTGSIKGIVVGGGAQVMASVNVGDTVVSAYTDDMGAFYLHGLPAGTYTVTLTAAADLNLPPITVENVVVVNGETSDLGTLTFP